MKNFIYLFLGSTLFINPLLAKTIVMQCMGESFPKEVAEFYRLDMQLRIYKLKEQSLSHTKETSLLDAINEHIKVIDEHMIENDKDNYWSVESFGK